MSPFARLFTLTLALVLPPLGGAALFLAVSRTPLDLNVSLPSSRYDPQHCTSYCHDHGCLHRAMLPDFLAGDQGAFGLTIVALRAGGRATGLGYQGFNILIYCVTWPLVTGALYAGAVGRFLWRR